MVKEGFENGSHVLRVFFSGVRVDEDVIEEGNTELIKVLTQSCVNVGLKGRWSIG